MVSRSSLDQLGWWQATTVSVTEEMNTLALTLSSLVGLNPLAGTGTSPHGLEETKRSGVSISAVVLAHDLLDSLGGLIGMVEWDGADVVMSDVSFDDSVKQGTADESEFTVNCGCGASGEVPGLVVVVRESGIGVLKVCDGHCDR